MVGKAEVIRRRGRAAWEALPRGEKHRRGHRQFITYRTFLEMRI